MKSLIEIGEDVNAKDRFNETALMKVAWRGNLNDSNEVNQDNLVLLSF